MLKKFKLVPKNFNLVPEKNKISTKKNQNSAKEIQNSSENIQKITDQDDWILTKRVCDVITLFIALTKSPSARGESHLPAFTGNCLTISHTIFSLI